VIFINEWFPNPVGADTAGEFVELYNGGASAVSMRGWILKNEGGKKFSFTTSIIPARGYLLLKRSISKISLRNTDGGLSLYNAAGTLMDHGEFQGGAPEGQSFSRVDYGTGPEQHFMFVTPTPGAVNKTVSTVIAVNNYPIGAALNPQFTSSAFFAIMVGTAALVACLIIYVIKTHEDLLQLFFRRDEKTW
jgi:hypothetical protein